MSCPMKERLKFQDKFLKYTYYDDLEEEDDYEGFRHKPKDKYCQVCHKDYNEEYFEHI